LRIVAETIGVPAVSAPAGETGSIGATSVTNAVNAAIVTDRNLVVVITAPFWSP
jgi:hypothetical protein